MHKITPVILANNIEEFQEKLEALASFSNTLQIDIADGEFVENKTIGLEEIKNLPSDKEIEVHLMVKAPSEYLEECKRLGAKRAIFHVEAGNVDNNVSKFKEKGLEVFLAINPETNIADLDMFVKNIDGVLLMSVNPGLGGQKLIEAVLEKATKLRGKYPDLIIEIDGGVNKENIKKVLASGINVAAIGSGILKAQNPKKEWQALEEFCNF